MSFNGKGEYMGRSPEDDEYEHAHGANLDRTLRVGSWVEHRLFSWHGEVQEVIPYGFERVEREMYRVQWEGLGCDEEYYDYELKVIG